MVNNNNDGGVHYYSYKAAEDANCPICLEPLENTDAVAHEGLGHLHALHRSCAKSSAVFNDKCPTCRMPIDKDSLITWKDRAIIKLGSMGAVIKTVALGTVGAALGAVAIVGLAALAPPSRAAVIAGVAAAAGATALSVASPRAAPVGIVVEASPEASAEVSAEVEMAVEAAVARATATGVVGATRTRTRATALGAAVLRAVSPTVVPAASY
jgi:Ring finger domain